MKRSEGSKRFLRRAELEKIPVSDAEHSGDKAEAGGSGALELRGGTDEAECGKREARGAFGEAGGV